MTTFWVHQSFVVYSFSHICTWIKKKKNLMGSGRIQSNCNLNYSSLRIQSDATGACVRVMRVAWSSYLQSNVAELTTLSQGVHFGHSGIQETLILKDQVPIRNHFG